MAGVLCSSSGSAAGLGVIAILNNGVLGLGISASYSKGYDKSIRVTVRVQGLGFRGLRVIYKGSCKGVG